MKTLLFILYFAQFGTDTLPTQKVLEASIDSFFAQKANIDITEFQTTNKYDRMKWLPSVGVGYAIDGRPRPIANYSLDRFYTHAKIKEVNKLKIETLRRTAAYEAQKLKFEGRILLKKYELLQTEIAFFEKNIAIDDEIFTIETDKVPPQRDAAQRLFEAQTGESGEASGVVFEAEWVAVVGGGDFESVFLG